MHIKYSDASFIEKTSSIKKITSRNEIKPCCKVSISESKKDGNIRCIVCDNDIYIGASE